MQNYRYRCCYCEGRFTLENALQDDILVFEKEKWHKKCYEGKQNIEKYRRGEYPQEWYADDTARLITEDFRGNRVQAPKRNIVLNNIRELLKTQLTVTWRDIVKRCHLNKNDVVIFKKLLQYGHIEVVFKNENNPKLKYATAIITKVNDVSI